MRLVYKETGIEVKVGDKVRYRDDKEEATIVSFEKPRHSASSGRITVVDTGDNHPQSYFPHVFDAEWIEREDR